MELYKEYRPKSLKEIVGQPLIVEQLTNLLEEERIPQAILLSGFSGTGKTSISRILKTELKCSDLDFQEINAADSRGIDMVRDLHQYLTSSPKGGNVKIYLIDEVHRLTSDAQAALLKTLEDTPVDRKGKPYVYFFLATTDPQKLLKTIRTRCTEFSLKLINDKDMLFLLKNILEKTLIELDTPEVLDKIVECAEGSARKALVLLNSIAGISGKQLETIQKSSGQEQMINLARLLTNYKSKPSWSEVAKILKELEDEPESIRRMLLGYCQAIILNGKNDRAFLIMKAMQYPFYDTGKPGLTMACYEIIHGN